MAYLKRFGSIVALAFFMRSTGVLLVPPVPPSPTPPTPPTIVPAPVAPTNPGRPMQMVIPSPRLVVPISTIYAS